MIAEERRTRILELVNRSGAVSLPDLVAELETSESTIRRDLATLHEEGLLRKVHGGATRVAAQSTGYITADQSLAGRTVLHQEEKRVIGAFAASLINPEDFVFIDGGSTTECIVDAIVDNGATFLTNSLPHAQKLLAKGCHTILPGGEVKPVTEVLVGAETVMHIQRYHFTICFMGTNGADLETGYTTPEFNEAAVKQMAMQHSERPFVVCDHSKFMQVAPITFADFGAATVICDRLTDTAYADATNIVRVEDHIKG